MTAVSTLFRFCPPGPDRRVVRRSQAADRASRSRAAGCGGRWTEPGARDGLVDMIEPKKRVLTSMMTLVSSSRVRARFSISVAADRLVALSGAERAPCGEVHRVFDRANAAVGHADIHAAGMPAAS